MASLSLHLRKLIKLNMLVISFKIKGKVAFLSVTNLGHSIRQWYSSSMLLHNQVYFLSAVTIFGRLRRWELNLTLQRKLFETTDTSYLFQVNIYLLHLHLIWWLNTHCNGTNRIVKWLCCCFVCVCFCVCAYPLFSGLLFVLDDLTQVLTAHCFTNLFHTFYF